MSNVLVIVFGEYFGMPHRRRQTFVDAGAKFADAATSSIARKDRTSFMTSSRVWGWSCNSFNFTGSTGEMQGLFQQQRNAGPVLGPRAAAPTASMSKRQPGAYIAGGTPVGALADACLAAAARASSRAWRRERRCEDIGQPPSLGYDRRWRERSGRCNGQAHAGRSDRSCGQR